MKKITAVLIALLMVTGAFCIAEEVDMETIELAERESVKLSAQCLPKTAGIISQCKTVIWSSSDPEVAVVERGYVLRAKRAGECVFTGASDGADVASFKVIVNPGKPIEGQSATLPRFTRLKLSEENVPGAGAILKGYPDIMWKSSDNAVAIINNDNYIYAKGVGACDIFGMSEDMEVAKISVTVVDNPDVTEKFIAFTFDDGPSKPTWTILDTLSEYGINATFFMVGEMVDLRPSTTLAVFEAGCEIGNHSYNHKDLDEISEERAREEIKSTDEAIFNVTGQYPTVLRAPGGSLSPSKAEKYGDGRYFIYWTMGTGDWKSRDTDTVYNYVMSHLHDNAVVLMHDLYPTTAKAFDRLAPKLILEGYTFLTVSQMIEHTGPDGDMIYARAK